MRKIVQVFVVAFIGLSAKVNAQIVNIPDVHFYNALLSNGVVDSAGYITVSTAKAFTGLLEVGDDTISDLTGIEAFTALSGLDCSYNSLTSLNLPLDSDLAYLDCSYNNLTSLDVSLNTGLSLMDCSFDGLTSLNVSNNVALSYLDCGNDSLTSLDLSSNTILQQLHCNGNMLTSLNLASNANLSILDCNTNGLTSLDVSANTTLTYLYCYNNSLVSLDLTSNKALVILQCSSNSLTGLNVKNGNNHILSNFSAVNNTNLSCIEVDSVAYSNANWVNKDPWAHYSTNCLLTDVNEMTAEADISVYPNPVNSELTIKSAELKMTNSTAYIIDMLGRTVFCSPLPGRGAGSQAFDVSALPAGLYFIRLADDEKSWVGKFVKE